MAREFGRVRAAHVGCLLLEPIAQIGRAGRRSLDGDELRHEALQLVARQHDVVPVAHRSSYVGMLHLDDLMRVPRDSWSSTAVREVMRADTPTVEINSTLGQALRVLERVDLDQL